jgi:hypothetical protein
VLIQMEENSATLTPFGSLIRITPNKPDGAKSWSWTAKLRAVLCFALSLIKSRATSSAR